MAYGPFEYSTPRLPVTVLVLLAGIYLLSGVTGRDPWLTEDAIHIAIARGFATDGNWLLPHVAGEAWPHTAPLYHWIAALLGGALDGLLPFHDAARLTTTLFGAIFLVALAGAAKTFHGEVAGRFAPLLAIGTLGLLLPVHEAQPAIAGLACAAIAWWGGGLVLVGHRHGALLLGLGLGLAFPAHGLAGLVMAAAAVVAPLLRRDGKFPFYAILIALPLTAAWPLLLHHQDPGLWSAWWRNEFAEATIGRNLPEVRHLKLLLWGAWPVLPLALWSLWQHRRQPSPLSLPILGAALTLAWYLTGSSRSLAILPALLPLTLLAASGAERLRRGAANAFDWFGLMTFSFVAALIWLGASAQAFDWPPRIARNFDKLAPGHEAGYALAGLAFAAALTTAWLMSWWLRRASWRASLRWAAGVTLIWGLAMALWLPWIDHAMSLRPVAVSLRDALPSDADCVERVNIGIGQRAALDYFAGIRTEAPSRKRQCGWRLVIDDKDRAAQAGWTEVWQGGRTSDRKERWYLDRRGR